ncbi:MAG: hypothetical protein ACRCRZ_03055 [Metamycoplasmataceae bacterium]
MEQLEDREKYIEIVEKYPFILTQNQLQIMKLYLYEDLSLKEISEIVATTRAAVFDAIKKSKKKLNQFLEN